MQTIGIDAGAVYHESSRMFHGSLKNIMGTRFDALIIGQDRWGSHGVWNKIVSKLRRLDQVFNRFDEDSETSMINRNAADGPVLVSPEMWTILQSCKDYHSRTLGLFDITLHDFTTIIPDEETRSVTFSKNDVALDFGGYAKGYTLAKIKDIMHQAGVTRCFVNFGNSSILGMGHHPYGESWKVSIQNPYHPDSVLDEIPLRDQALSVSGNTPDYTGHIVQPASGKTVNEPKVVSITTDDPLDAEVLSTVFMMANKKEKEQIARNFHIQSIAEYNI